MVIGIYWMEAKGADKLLQCTSSTTRKPLAPNVNAPRLGILDRTVSSKAISHSDRDAYREAFCKPGSVFRDQGGLDDKTQNPMQIS